MPSPESAPKSTPRAPEASKPTPKPSDPSEAPSVRASGETQALDTAPTLPAAPAPEAKSGNKSPAPRKPGRASQLSDTPTPRGPRTPRAPKAAPKAPVIPGSAEARFVTKTNPGAFNTKGWELKEYPAGNPNPLFIDGTYGEPYDAEATKATRQSEKAHVPQRALKLANAAFNVLDDLVNIKTFGGAKTKKGYPAEKNDPSLERDNPLKRLSGRIGEAAKRNHQPKDRDADKEKPEKEAKEPTEKSGKAADRYRRFINWVGDDLNKNMKIHIELIDAAKARKAVRVEKAAKKTAEQELSKASIDEEIAKLEKSLATPNTKEAKDTKPERDPAIKRIVKQIARVAMVNYGLLQKVGFDKYITGYAEPALRAKVAEASAKLPKITKKGGETAKPAES